MLTVVEADRDLCKRVVNGELLSYQKAYIYTPHLEEINNLEDLSVILTKLENEPRKAVLRSIPKDMTPGRRLSNRYEHTAQPWLCLDADAPAPDGCPDYVREPEQALDWMIEHKWPFLRGVGVHWQLGNSAGVVPQSKKMSWHLWVWLDRPVTKCSKWLGLHGFDVAMTRSVQIHYTASPIGVHIPKRSGYRQGAPLVGVVEDPPPTRSGVKFSKGYTCTEEDEMNMASELAALKVGPSGRNPAIMQWIIRAVTVAYPKIHEDATRWLVENGRDRDVAESEVSRLIAWAQEGLESGTLEPDINLRPDLGFDDDDPELLGEEKAQEQAEALGVDSLVESFQKAEDRLDWLSDNAKRLARADAMTIVRVRNLWGNGVRDLDRVIKEAKGLAGEEDAPDWAQVAQDFITNRENRLVYVDEEWYSWNGRFYEHLPEVWVKKEISDFIASPTTGRVANAYQQLQFASVVTQEGEPAGTPFLNGRLMPDGKLIPHHPDTGGRYCLDFDYNPSATCPTWERCLRDWFSDEERPMILRQWFSYLLTGRTDVQKIMLLMGTQRGGKGTTLSVMQDLMGHDNYSTPSMSNFASEFGLESSLGKRAMFISDAHLPSRDRSTILDRLKGISGQDRLDVNRKNRLQLKGVRLGQIVIACNEMGDIQDESNALIDRYSVIQFTKSFLGKEDPELGQKIRGELSGIFNWAMACAPFVRFHEDKRGKKAKEEMTHSSNPVRAWANTECSESSDGYELTDTLFQSFKVWCEQNAIRRIPAKNAFVRSLRSVFPESEVDTIREGETRHKILRGVVNSQNSIRDKIPLEEREDAF